MGDFIKKNKKNNKRIYQVTFCPHRQGFWSLCQVPDIFSYCYLYRDYEIGCSRGKCTVHLEKRKK